MTNLKKYTNADFYKNGVFQQEIAIEAMKEMFVHYNIYRIYGREYVGNGFWSGRL